MHIITPVKDFFAAVFAKRGPTALELQEAHLEASQIEQEIASRLAELPKPMGYQLAGNLEGIARFSGLTNVNEAKIAVRNLEDSYNGYYHGKIDAIEQLVLTLAKNDDVKTERIETFLSRQTRALEPMTSAPVTPQPA